MRRSFAIRPLTVLPALVLSLALAACGGDEETTTTTTIEATTAAAAPTATAETEAATAEASGTDAATEPTASTETATDASSETGAADTTATSSDPALEPLLLAVEDLPAGFEQTEYANEAGDCLGPRLDPAAAAVQAPNAFTDGQAEARSRAWSFASEEDAQAAFADASGEETRTCVLEGADLDDPELEPGGTIADEDLELAQAAGADEQSARRYIATITPKGATEAITAYSDLVLARVGDKILAYQFLTLAEPFPADATGAAVEGSVGRAAGGM
jgi:hypothetical protein